VAAIVLAALGCRSVLAISLTLPPVIERELRLASRQAGTYWGRIGAGAVGILLFFTVMNSQLAIGPVGSAGLFTFRVLAGVGALVMVTTILPAAAAAFAREKREDTLGLLFLTPLKPVDLVLGKLVSTSLGAFYRFVAFIPLLALPMLAGGVSAGNLVLLLVALLNLVFYAAALGLCVSAQAWDEKRASTTATLAFVGLSIILPAMMILSTPISAVLGAYAAGLSPLFPVWQASRGGGVRLGEFGWSLAVTQGLAWYFFRRACQVLPTCWRNEPVLPSPVLRAARLGREAALVEHLQRATPTAVSDGRVSPPSPARARRMVRRQFDEMHRQQLLERNPALWMAQRWRVDSAAAWIVGCLPLGAPIAILLSGQLEIFVAPAFVLFASYCVNAGFKIYAAKQAGLAFSRDRAEDTLELVLSTPMPSRQLVHGHVLAVLEPLRSILRRVIGIECGWMAVAIITDLLAGNEGTLRYLLLFAAAIGLFIPDLRAVVWTGLWQGVISKSAGVAAANAQGLVLVLPWTLAIVSAVISSWFVPSGIVFGLPLVSFSIGADWWFTRCSRRRLDWDLPLWAQRRVAQDHEHYDNWRRAGRALGRWWATGQRSLLSRPGHTTSRG